jgi:hypothetical protein
MPSFGNQMFEEERKLTPWAPQHLSWTTTSTASMTCAPPSPPHGRLRPALRRMMMERAPRLRLLPPKDARYEALARNRTKATTVHRVSPSWPERPAGRRHATPAPRRTAERPSSRRKGCARRSSAPDIVHSMLLRRAEPQRRRGWAGHRPSSLSVRGNREEEEEEEGNGMTVRALTGLIGGRPY